MELSKEEIKQKINSLGKWFHNLDLAGVQTAPDHFLGDYPAVKWKRFCGRIPADLSGKSVLDIGCNAGFYSIEMKRRNASRVLGIDNDDLYLEQARFASRIAGAEIEFRNLSVYEIGYLKEKFDIVLFMGVFYHLRYPLLALDLIRKYAIREMLVFQSMQRGFYHADELQEDYNFWEEEIFRKPGFPSMYFIEKKYSGDPTNWWIPNRACTEALLRSSGFEVIDHPEKEVYICRPAIVPHEFTFDILPFEIERKTEGENS